MTRNLISVYIPRQALPITSVTIEQKAQANSRLGYVLFLLVNATLFLRPAELIPALDKLPIYLVLILACLAVSLPRVLEEFSWRTMQRWPLSLCVVGLLAAVVLSQLSHFAFADAVTTGMGFLKMVLYFVLLVANVNSFARLKQFMLALVLFTSVMTAMSVLQYHGLINIEQIKTMFEAQYNSIDEDTGEAMRLGRLCSLGIFNNPNDLSRILVVGIFISLFFLGDRQQGMARYFWALPLGLLAYANALTYSRGGFLGLLGGLVLLCYVRFGKVRTIIIGVLLLPILLLLFGGRQTSINLGEEDTGYLRILLWRDGFAQLVHSPIFGIGAENYPTISGGAVAHNSFVHAFTELGLFGGSLFVGLFLFSIWPLHKAQPVLMQPVDRELWRMRPFIIAILGSYAVGLLSSARCYVEPTYALAGMAAVYCRLITPKAPKAIIPFNGKALRQLVTVSLLVLAAHYIFVRIET